MKLTSILRNKAFRLFNIDKIVDNKVTMAVAKELRSHRALKWTPKAIYQTRADIKTWNDAQSMALDVEYPKNYALQLLFDEIRKDALLTSQIQNRKLPVFSSVFSLKKQNGETDEEWTDFLKNSLFYRTITDAILESLLCGYNMIELGYNDDKNLIATIIPRTNYTPVNGHFYNDYLEDINPIKYRELPEYGRWIFEFNQNDLGLLNKAVPHVLFKRFAQSCWSELCEIYGIPPRVMKTNTADPKMLARAEQMMRDMGAAAWFIIDETEAFEWAKGADTNGDVYKNLINLCNNENSLLISGAVIGQDTVNGNRSKDEAAQDMLYELVKADMQFVEDCWNNIVIPGLVKIGVLPAGLKFEFEPSEDTEQLFKFTTGLLPYKDVDNEWIKEKFGVEVKDKALTSFIGDGGTGTNDEQLKLLVGNFFG